jgi:hypothetical protein
MISYDKAREIQAEWDAAARNARLIAAAPELLAALTGLLNVRNMGWTMEQAEFNGYFDKARTALAKVS